MKSMGRVMPCGYETSQYFDLQMPLWRAVVVVVSALTFFVTPLLTLCSTSANADDFVRNLVLRCEGKSEIYMPNIKGHEYSESTFRVTLFFKDGVVRDQHHILQGKDCSLSGGKVRCESTEIVKLRLPLTGAEKRHSVLLLDRNSGDLRLFLDTWIIQGGRMAKNPGLRLIREGACRRVEPVF